MATYRYLGEIIEPCEYASGQHRGRWIVRSYHAGTGLPYADELCSHHRTLAEARQSIALAGKS